MPTEAATICRELDLLLDFRQENDPESDSGLATPTLYSLAAANLAI